MRAEKGSGPQGFVLAPACGCSHRPRV